mmetsp:Transcript_90499/g.235660  ORF Transcript_90499/g.235660 Transcript_90499/m.235660 type:complete len:234 (+) Transcript_90499:657-1358(+)
MGDDLVRRPGEVVLRPLGRRVRDDRRAADWSGVRQRSSLASLADGEPSQVPAGELEREGNTHCTPERKQLQQHHELEHERNRGHHDVFHPDGDYLAPQALRLQGGPRAGVVRRHEGMVLPLRGHRLPHRYGDTDVPEHHRHDHQPGRRRRPALPPGREARAVALRARPRRAAGGLRGGAAHGAARVPGVRGLRPGRGPLHRRLRADRRLWAVATIEVRVPGGRAAGRLGVVLH